MIEPLHACVADRAVRGAGWSIYVAGVAVLDFQVVSLDVHGKHFVYESDPGNFLADWYSRQLG